ncbi:isopentenyl-diphosphate Delta-isomerase [Xanthovirga aplysinae]|uniref:isopentenyl-diphosphate Delta-isomerase n=1 Tax=Xanthovirga aplysinae TaxID=2529853 RepID=UPI0012BC6CD9|nr:isopentenyl-diphosphate Delta-isomerase [Xanthovirga aplysinae]MTI33495.1 isopentenyl-diphosphate Delta-isomerase [Xanthovirga aplysinae]
MKEEVILVDRNDCPHGTMEKIEAHKKGVLHRAFSIFIFNDNGELMLQRRALHKYHSGGLWTNTCCSHPREGEELLAAAHRRLKEEMGFICPLQHKFHFIYNAHLDNGLIEHELDHVFVGNYPGTPKFNPEEVMDYRFTSLQKLEKEISQSPEKFTEWLKIILPKIQEITLGPKSS